MNSDRKNTGSKDFSDCYFDQNPDPIFACTAETIAECTAAFWLSVKMLESLDPTTTDTVTEVTRFSSVMLLTLTTVFVVESVRTVLYWPVFFAVIAIRYTSVPFFWLLACWA